MEDLDMTLREATDKRIPRVRQAVWAPRTYLRLPLLHGGYVGPWAELYDDETQEEVLMVRPGSQRILIVQDHEDDWEEYSGPASPHEQAEGNFARTYSEK